MRASTSAWRRVRRGIGPPLLKRTMGGGAAYIAPAHLRQSMQSDDGMWRSAFLGGNQVPLRAVDAKKVDGVCHSRQRFMSVGLGIVYTCCPQLQLPVIMPTMLMFLARSILLQGNDLLRIWLEMPWLRGRLRVYVCTAVAPAVEETS